MQGYARKLDTCEPPPCLPFATAQCTCSRAQERVPRYAPEIYSISCDALPILWYYPCFQ